VSKRELLRRIEAIEAKLAQPAGSPLAGQQTIHVPTIGHHTYEGPGPCQRDLFGTVCGAHRDAHELIDEDDLEETL
jgi:hypothetical protein